MSSVWDREWWEPEGDPLKGIQSREMKVCPARRENPGSLESVRTRLKGSGGKTTVWLLDPGADQMARRPVNMIWLLSVRKAF